MYFEFDNLSVIIEANLDASSLFELILCMSMFCLCAILDSIFISIEFKKQLICICITSNKFRNINRKDEFFIVYLASQFGGICILYSYFDSTHSLL